MTCDRGSKRYLFQAAGDSLVLDPICGVVQAHINGQIYTARDSISPPLKVNKDEAGASVLCIHAVILVIYIYAWSDPFSLDLCISLNYVTTHQTIIYIYI